MTTRPRRSSAPPPGSAERGLRNVQPPPNPAGPKNQRALRHGARSELQLRPLRDHHAAELRRDFPHVDDRRVALLADRLARLDSARRWLDEQDGLVRNEQTGEVYAVVQLVEKWASRAEKVLAEIEAERREPVPVDVRLREHLEGKAAES